MRPDLSHLMKPAIRYILYARRSSDREDLQALSIDQQLEELHLLAAKRNLEIVEEMTESASAKDPGRPIFNELIKQLQKGKAQGILVWKLDRLARNMADAGEVIILLSNGILREIVTPDATYTNTGDSKFMLAMSFGAAAKYTDDLAAAVRRGNRYVLERGKVPGPVPLGYMKTHEHEVIPGAGTVIPDPERFEAVKNIWKEVLAGNSNVSDIWRKARMEWGLTSRPSPHEFARPVSITNVFALLRNPFYAGKVSRGGSVYDGEHPPMVTLQQFQEVQDILKSRHNYQRIHHDHDFMYQGLLHCGHCSRVLSGERHEKGDHTYIYYRCGRRRAGYLRCNAPAISEEHVTKELAHFFETVTIDSTVRDWAFEAVAWWAGNDEPSPEKIVRRAKARLARAEQELETLTDMAVQGLITNDEYKVRRINQMEMINHYRESLVDPLEKLNAWKLLKDEQKKNGLKLAEDFLAGDNLARRRIVTRTCTDVIITNGKAHMQLKYPFVVRPKPPDLQSGLSTNNEAIL